MNVNAVRLTISLSSSFDTNFHNKRIIHVKPSSMSRRMTTPLHKRACRNAAEDSLHCVRHLSIRSDFFKLIASGVHGIDFVSKEDSIDNYVTLYDNRPIPVDCVCIELRNTTFHILGAKGTEAQLETKVRKISDKPIKDFDSRRHANSSGCSLDNNNNTNTNTNTSNESNYHIFSDYNSF